ncbi:MAG TPA: hypothetical protein ENH13_07365 [Euryarchaeota archaeon]|nr:hypothetical protein BMS3Bbin16_00245 [archaeon BMS3Bbin16]HDH28937.1 hypothetical protein [Euryarchaeota archaeon]
MEKGGVEKGGFGSNLENSFYRYAGLKVVLETNTVARKNTRAAKNQSNKRVGGGRAAPIALILIVGVVAVLAWASIGLKPETVVSESGVQLPSYAFASARSEQAYRASLDPVIQKDDVLSKMPCYCGCKGVGHTSLKSCFLDDHGSYCGVCQAEALESYEMAKAGYSIAEIRAQIDAKYGGGRFGQGTDTPPVA